jgi:hypothetical protein
MNYTTTIAYDFDGVLCNTMPAFHQFWFEKYNWNIWEGEARTFLMPMPEDYDFKNINTDIQEALNMYQAYLHPHAYAMEMVREMARQFNEQPIIVTARAAVNKDATDAWLKFHLGIPYTLYCIGGDTGEGKPEVLAGMHIRYFVEDRFKTVNNIKSCETVFMPSRPWNTGRTPLDHVVRVNNLIEVWDYIMQEGEDDS